jgi:putative hydrolase of the HAD superfamily
MKYLIWDFDGTLGYRDGVTWSAVLLEVLDRCMPGHAFAAEQIAPYLRSGFPWHAPERPHAHIGDPAEWWSELAPVFARAYMAVGIAPEVARSLACEVRPVYSDPARFRLFDDTLDVLNELSARGWTHVILSNHVPEFDRIAAALGLHGRMQAVFNSAVMGYEKPHPAAFSGVLALVGDAAPRWMIGDNYAADVQGAAAVGIPGILVRKPHPAAERFCPDLGQVVAFLEGGPCP